MDNSVGLNSPFREVKNWIFQFIWGDPTWLEAEDQKSKVSKSNQMTEDKSADNDESHSSVGSNSSFKFCWFIIILLFFHHKSKTLNSPSVCESEHLN